MPFSIRTLNKDTQYNDIFDITTFSIAIFSKMTLRIMTLLIHL